MPRRRTNAERSAASRRTLARWERVYARMRAELGTVRAALPSIVREVGDVETDLAHLDAALRIGGSKGAPRPRFDPRDLELTSASLRGGGTLRVRFARGADRELDLGLLGLPSRAISVAVDDLRRGVVLRLANGEVVDVSAGRILYETDPAYRAAHVLPPERKPDLGARVRAIRLAAGRTARDVAAASGLAPSNYARLEASRHAPRVDTLLRVARALGVSLADLVASVPRGRSRR